MWSDTLLLAERAHLQQLIVWGAASVLVGTLVLTLLAVGRVRSALLVHFSLQTLVWGAIDLVIAIFAWRGLTDRDVDAATRLDRFLWLNAGLDAGYVGVGATLAITGWLLGRRLGPVGAGLAIIVQGLALLLLDARFINTIMALRVSS
ncbi:MAG TPA: hypothetical protein VKA84_12730 [Gemmatimonadaceae bacterium]|nr:hypothetical protein [Gemmatimonadaceae bacterium]